MTIGPERMTLAEAVTRDSFAEDDCQRGTHSLARLPHRGWCKALEPSIGGGVGPRPGGRSAGGSRSPQTPGLGSADETFLRGRKPEQRPSNAGRLKRALAERMA